MVDFPLPMLAYQSVKELQMLHVGNIYLHFPLDVAILQLM